MTERATTTRPVALVTGASSGSASSSRACSPNAGNDLVLVARDAGRLEALAKELEATHGSALRGAGRRPHRSPSELASVVERRVADVDVLVNNAGFGTFGSCFELDVDTEDRRDPAERRRARCA